MNSQHLYTTFIGQKLASFVFDCRLIQNTLRHMANNNYTTLAIILYKVISEHNNG